LSKEEVDAIIQATFDDREFLFYNTLLNLARKTGRRLGEYYSLKVKDVDFKSQTIYTLVLKKRKKVKSEAILDDQVCALLNALIKTENLEEDNFVFRKFSYRTIQRKFKLFAKKAGIVKNVTFHHLRHYVITGLLREGWSLSWVQRISGHTSLSSLSIYDHVVASDLKKEIQDVMKKL
jgi:integrase/recombinase XerD